MSEDRCKDLPQPQPEQGPGGLPSALTFYVSRSQRALILRALRTLSDDRATALVLAGEMIEQRGSEHG